MLFQSSMSHDLLEVILIGWFCSQEALSVLKKAVFLNNFVKTNYLINRKLKRKAFILKYFVTMHFIRTITSDLVNVILMINYS